MSVAESVIRSAMVRRRWDRGFRSTGPHCSNFGSAGSTPTDRSGLRTAACSGACPAGATGRRSAPPLTARTSSSVTRPPGPVALTVSRSTPSSRASRLVAGVAGTGPTRVPAPAGPLLAPPEPIAGSDAGPLPRPAVAVVDVVEIWFTSPPRRRQRRVVECDEHLADLHGLPGLDVDARHATAERRGDLDRGLVSLDLEERRVLGDDVALIDEDLDDLGLGQSLT